MWKLTIVDDEGTKTVLPLSRGEYNIGRDPENTVRLTERNISRKHLVLRRNGIGWVVEDLSSYNGCFVNGLRVSGTHPLHDGDLLQVGDYRLEIADEEKAAVRSDLLTTQTVPAASAKLVDRPDRLVVVDGAAAGTEYPLEGDRLIVGRAEDADVSINHSSVSRVHAEVIRIAPGTFEIIDCGSSNGIRLNGIKLDRRVIEDDDEIELGDVRVRFVARGRIFRPGTVPRHSHTPEESASGVRTGVSKPAHRGLGMMVTVGTLLGVALVTSVVLLRQKHDPIPQPPGATTATAPSAELPPGIGEAKRLASSGDLDGAHARLMADVQEGSPHRDNPDVKRIEGEWADARLRKAAEETDPAKRRALLNEIAQARLVDSTRRKMAADELNRLEDGGTDISSLPVPSGATTDSTAPGDWRSYSRSDSRSDRYTKNPKDSKGAASPTTDVGTGPDLKDAINADSQTKVRKQLEPLVYSGRANIDQVKMLRAICRQQKDSACVSRASQVLQDMNKNQ